MKKAIKYSKAFHWLAFLFLLTPFYYDGCGSEHNAETTTTETAVIMDSTQKEVPDISYSTIPQHADKKLSEQLSNKYPIIKPVLNPQKDEFSGLAAFIDTTEYVHFMATFFFVVLLVLGLAVKYIEGKTYNAVLLIHLLSIIFLFLAHPCFIQYKKLWGYWAMLVVVCMLSVYDVWVMMELRKKVAGTPKM